MSGGDREQRNERLRSIGELLRDINADVVVLNEVDFNSTWSYGVNQARELAIEAGYAFVAEQRNLDFQIVFGSWQFGNVVLSRYPISNASLVNYPSLRTWEAVLAGKKRGMLCQIDFNGQPVTVAAIHLSHRSEDLRLASAEMILARVHGVAHPIILAGDFNSSPSDFPHSQQTSSNDNTIDMLDRANCLRRRPTEGPADSEYTFRSNVPDRTIDWIMISNDCQFNSYRAVDSQLSDHRPVVADVLLP